MNEKILLIEDNEDNCHLFCYLLKRVGYNVTTAPDAEEASKILENYVPDIILCDISLPGINGNQF